MNKEINYSQKKTKQIKFTTSNIIRSPQYIFLLLIVFNFVLVNKNTKAQSTLPAQHNLQEIINSSENEEKGIEETGVEKLSISRPLKSIPITFSGFKIMLLSSPNPLSKEHEIFQQFGEIFLYETETEYQYLIGNFTSRNKAVDFATKRLSKNYPNYKISEYIGGEHLEITPITVNH